MQGYPFDKQGAVFGIVERSLHILTPGLDAIGSRGSQHERFGLLSALDIHLNRMMKRGGVPGRDERMAMERVKAVCITDWM